MRGREPVVNSHGVRTGEVSTYIQYKYECDRLSKIKWDLIVDYMLAGN